jgi:hypothetical protein
MKEDERERMRKVKNIRTGLEFIMLLNNGPVKVTDWDDDGNVELETDGRREWHTKNNAAEQIHLAFELERTRKIVADFEANRKSK